MARDLALLTSTAPTTIAPAQVHIGHVQLRDLIICPRERGIVNYVQDRFIVEQNLKVPATPVRTLAELAFTPNTLTSLPIAGTNNTLLAAGGQEAEIHLSLHGPSSSRSRHKSLIWKFETQMHGSINNSVLLTSLSLTRSNESSVEPRVGISNNDCTVKFYDVPMRTHGSKQTLREAGSLRLDVPVNHSSISPDGRTLLSVGDSSKVYLHRMAGGSRINFSSIATLVLPPPDISPLIYPSSSLAASFSTAFSSDGTKFAVASQEGVVAVWDVRSTKALKVFQTDKSRVPGGNGGATGWLSDDPWEWTRGNSKAPGWSVRSVKFGGGGDGRSGKEIMTFTEHTSLFHVVDARTFETEEVVRVPYLRRPPQPSPPPQSQPQPSAQHHQSRPHPSRQYSFTQSASPTRLNSPSPSQYTLTSGLSPRPRRIARAPSQSQYRTPTIVQALEDTFRIPSTSSTPSPYGSPPGAGHSAWPQMRGSTRNMEAELEEDGDEILVIPPMGDRDVDSDVRALLGRHGLRAGRSSRRRGVFGEEEGTGVEEEDRGGTWEDGDTNTGSTHADYEYQPESGSATVSSTSNTFIGRRLSGDEDMEVDELESDCGSSHTPSRSSSPSPSTHVPVQASPTSGRLETPGLGRGRGRGEQVYEDDLDLAGTCFDPTGGFVYVASTEGVVEWSVRGAEKKWWFEKGWV